MSGTQSGLSVPGPDDSTGSPPVQPGTSATSLPPAEPTNQDSRVTARPLSSDQQIARPTDSLDAHEENDSVIRSSPAQEPSQVATSSHETTALASDNFRDEDAAAQAPARRTKTKKKPSKLMTGSYDWWWWELTGAFVGLAVVASIVGILIQYHNKSEPKWPRGLKAGIPHPHVRA